MTGIFHEYFLNQYTQVKIINEDYLWYLLRWRVMPLALAVCVANLGFRRLTAAGILLWTGFAAGILSVAAVLRMGLCGMLLCIAGIFPQYIFYVPAYLLLIRYYYRYPQSEWSHYRKYPADVHQRIFRPFACRGFYSIPGKLWNDESVDRKLCQTNFHPILDIYRPVCRYRYHHRHQHLLESVECSQTKSGGGSKNRIKKDLII